MANAYYSRITYVYGDSKYFTIPFDYIRQSDIHVFINNIETSDFVFNTNSQIEIKNTLNDGDVIEIQRITPIEERDVVFTDTSILNKETQNLANEQVFYGLQEVTDGFEHSSESAKYYADKAAKSAEDAETSNQEAKTESDKAKYYASLFSETGQVRTDYNETDSNMTSYLIGREKLATKEFTEHLINKNLTNCILEAPSGVFVQNSDGKYMVPKGTRFLSADGKDINGNIKNLDVTLTSDVIISSIATTSSGLHLMFLQSNDKTNWFYGYREYKGQWFEQETIPTVADATWYNTKDKLWRIIQTADGNGQWYSTNCVPIALVNLNNGAINKIYWVNSVVELITNKSELSDVDVVDLSLSTTVPFDTMFQAPCNGNIFVWSRIEAAANVNNHPVSRDCVGYLNPATSTTGITVNQEYTQVGTYTFNAPTAGWYNMILVGGGGTGGKATGFLANGQVYSNGGSGGSGAAFAGQVYLTAGNHTITVGGWGGASSIDGLVVAGGGGAGGGNSGLLATGYAGAGGTLTVTGQTQNATIYSNGNAGQSFTGDATHTVNVTGGASLYNGWGSGAGSNSSPATGYAFISYQGSTSTITGTVCYVHRVDVNWDSTGNTVTVVNDSTSWINIEKGQKIKFVSNIGTTQTSMSLFEARFYPKKVEMKN